MPITVLVVDDSSFFRRRGTEILELDPYIKVIDSAVNGEEAVAKTKQLKPDVITMDIEMPVMDGITAVKKIMAQTPVPVLMFSSLTHSGATATLEALEAGALDFLPKKFEDIARNKEEAVQLLQQKVKAISRRRPLRATASLLTERAKPQAPRPIERPFSNPTPEPKTPPSSAGKVRVAKPFKPSGKHYQLLAIGTSTGGPVALQQILTKIPAQFPLPILLVQHMPAAFTPAFAQRLNSLCQIQVKEAQDGDIVRPGTAYLAPGGQQMMVEGRSGQGRLKVFQDQSSRVHYKPSVDITFGSAGRVYNDAVLAVILTGMGADGRDSARLLKQRGATIWSQDEQSSVVYGMPQAVAAAGLSDLVLPLDQFAEKIMAELGRR